MRIDVKDADGVLTGELREAVVRRVLLALTRFGPRVRRVTVCLAQPPNPLGGFDHHCQMLAVLVTGDVRAEAMSGGLEAAVSRAAARLACRVDCTVPAIGSRL